MKRSEDIDQLAIALAKAQSEFRVVVKNKTGKIKGVNKAGKPYEYEYKYADLTEIIDATKKALVENGFSLTQGMLNENKEFKLITLLMHKSGQWITSEAPLPLNESSQELGSSLTYLRRYSLGAILNIAAEEDTDAQEQHHEPGDKKQGHLKAVSFQPKEGVMEEVPPPFDSYGSEELPPFDSLPAIQTSQTSFLAEDRDLPLGEMKFTKGQFKGKTFDSVIKTTPTKVVGYASWIIDQIRKGDKMSEDFLKFVDYAKHRGFDIK